MEQTDSNDNQHSAPEKHLHIRGADYAPFPHPKSRIGNTSTYVEQTAGFAGNLGASGNTSTYVEQTVANFDQCRCEGNTSTYVEQTATYSIPHTTGKQNAAITSS